MVVQWLGLLQDLHIRKALGSRQGPFCLDFAFLPLGMSIYICEWCLCRGLVICSGYICTSFQWVPGCSTLSGEQKMDGWMDGQSVVLEDIFLLGHVIYMDVNCTQMQQQNSDYHPTALRTQRYTSYKTHNQLKTAAQFHSYIQNIVIRLSIWSLVGNCLNKIKEIKCL